MDQGSIWLFLARKKLSTLEIHNELVAVLGPEAGVCSTITKYRRQWYFPAIMSDAPAEPPLAIIDDAILDPLDNQAFSSIRELAKLACIPTTAVSRQLKSLLGLKVKHLHSVPRDLTEAQKAQHVTLSNQ
jgi:hypothetical protein